MSTDYFLPAVSSRTTSPPANESTNTAAAFAENYASGNNDSAITNTKVSYSLPQLPSLDNNSSRLSIGSIYQKSIRRPLSNIEMNNPREYQHDNLSNGSKSFSHSSSSSSSNKITDCKVTSQAMELDVAVNPDSGNGAVKKWTELVYPNDSKLPSRSLIQALFHEAMEGDIADEDSMEQKELCDAGILSLEQVLLPAVAYQEEQMLKEWQSVVQRDGSAIQKDTIVALRKTVYSGIGAACAAAKKSRQKRAVLEKERELQWRLQIEQKIAMEAQAHQKQQEAKDRQYRAAVQQRQRDLQKKLPANQDVWREVAYLMTELTKLSNEERQWRNDVVIQHLDRSEALLTEQENQFAENQKIQDDAGEMTDESLLGTTTETVNRAVACATDIASDITLAVERIRGTLRQVSNTVSICEQSRQHLYQQYVTHHQFYGYQGIHDPKGLLKVLSQSQADE